MPDGTVEMSNAGGAVLRDGPAVRDYLLLLKPRVMSLVVFTGLAGMLVAPAAVHPVLAAVAVLCIAVGAGASGAINMWYERDVDALMRRTRGRPLPAGRLEPDAALAFGVILAVGSVTLMGLALNWAAAALLALAIGFYVFIYTVWLKRRTPQNIVIGGAAGAFPPMIGWAAATGDVSLASLALFAIVFMWTPPHFWALALVKEGDYAKAGIPMLPVVAGARETKRQIVFYTLVLVPVSLAPWALGASGAIYAATAGAMGAMFVFYALRLAADAENRTAMPMFGFSILYLFVLFAALIADALAGGPSL